MFSFTIASCSVDDGPALARKNMSASWTDSTWVLIWPGKTLEHVIAQATRRMPRILLTDTARRRHQKVVDVESGAILGYARWILPDAGTTAGDPNILWTAARVPAVSKERESEAEREYAAADWNFDHGVDKLDEPVTEMKDRLLKWKNYLRECIFFFGLSKLEKITSYQFYVLIETRTEP